jgi:hypothetical protein
MARRGRETSFRFQPRCAALSSSLTLLLVFLSSLRFVLSAPPFIFSPLIRNAAGRAAMRSGLLYELAVSFENAALSRISHSLGTSTRKIPRVSRIHSMTIPPPPSTFSLSRPSLGLSFLGLAVGFL